MNRELLGEGGSAAEIPSVGILPMEEEHLSAVEQLGRECFSLPWSLEGYRAELKKPGAVCLTGWAGEQLAGFLCISGVLDEAEVGLLAVAPAWRRKGFGAALMKQGILACRDRGISLLRLEVRASNLGAVRLYEGLGFVREGVRKNYYRRPAEDALLYSLAISGPSSPP